MQPGLLTPPLVCGAVAVWDGSTIHGALLDRDAAVDALIETLSDERLILANLNIVFDLAVGAVEAQKRGIDLMPLIFRAYQQERIFDSGICEALHGIAQGHHLKDPRTNAPLRDPITGEQCGYRQSVVHDLVTGKVDAKVNARWRSSYFFLKGIPLEQWPADAREYPIDDTRNALEDALAQVGVLPNVGTHRWSGDVCTGCGKRYGVDAEAWCISRTPRRNLHDLAAQCYASWALHLGAIWGLRTDGDAVATLKAAVAHEREAGLPPFIEAGFIRGEGVKGKKAGTKDGAVVKRAVAIAYGVDPVSKCPEPTCVDGKVPSTKTGKPVNCARCNATGLDLDTAPVPRTEPSPTYPHGQVQDGRDVLIESGDELLMAFGEYKENDKIPDTYIPWLEQGVSRPIILRPNNPLETGRVSYSDVVQLLPRQVAARLLQALKARGSQLVGVRDCIVARPGKGFYSNDFSGGELVTWSQSSIYRVGWSDMAKVLNAGADVHAAFGATMMGCALDEFERKRKKEKSKRHKDFRQAAKPPNFGFPGGMAEVKLVLQQRKQGPDTPCPNGPVEVWSDDAQDWVRGYKGLRFCILVDGAERCGIVKITEWKRKPTPPVCRHCVEIAARLRETWRRTWSEAQPYLDWHAHNVDTVGEVVQHYSGRIRGGVDFCSESNGDFQGLLADIAKRAQCRVSFEQYVRVRVQSEIGTAWCPNGSKFEGQWSPLYGSRSILFAHDELFGEADLAVLPEVSERINEIMIEEFRRACPDLLDACKAEPTIMLRWWKSAEPVRDENGRLKPWFPKGYRVEECVLQ